MSPGLTDILLQKLSNGELDIVALDMPKNLKNFSNLQFFPLKKTVFCFVASKEYIKNNKIKSLKDLENVNIIMPKSLSNRRRLFDEFCNQNNLSLNGKYEISSSSIIKKLLLQNLGVGFISKDSLADENENLEIIKEIEFDDVTQGIATLKNKLCNKATIELVKEINAYYK